jgi:hypothetical protein
MGAMTRGVFHVPHAKQDLRNPICIVHHREKGGYLTGVCFAEALFRTCISVHGVSRERDTIPRNKYVFPGTTVHAIINQNLVTLYSGT